MKVFLMGMTEVMKCEGEIEGIDIRDMINGLIEMALKQNLWSIDPIQQLGIIKVAFLKLK